MDRLLTALSRAADGACVIDRAQHIAFWNEAAERMLGYTVDEVLGQPCYQVFCGLLRPGCMECRSECDVLRALSGQQGVPAYNLLSRTKQGITILLNMSVIVLPRDEAPLLTIHLFRDRTLQMQYETYVEQLLDAAEFLPLPRQTRDCKRRERNPLNLQLTTREKEVLALLVHGKTPRDIAATLGLSYVTVRNYLQSILRKFGVHSQRQVVKLALEWHLV